MKKLLATALLMSITALSGCNIFRVYTIDLPQGTPITAQQAAALQIGMTANQVLYFVGSPAIQDTLNPNRWDYLYDYTAGTDGKRKGQTNIKNASQRMSVYFDNGRVVRIDGRETLPQQK
ncbi:MULTISPECIES: outer membrane protein assembly factor BamE [unclassified Moraxella]|uniref:outer membrane protein assembly factor BamE n=1 Tax=unclassified Moraxella TaxID=2685852 RepID=UPI002B40F455|nr:MULTISPECIES: outer membrane protein assembly factor BamE [unclassified Moraxella]